MTYADAGEDSGTHHGRLTLSLLRILSISRFKISIVPISDGLMKERFNAQRSNNPTFVWIIF